MNSRNQSAKKKKKGKKVYEDNDVALHTTFADATIVSLYFSHIIFDGLGRKELLDAWVLTLQGRDDEVPAVIEDDPLELLEGRNRPDRLEKQKDTSNNIAKTNESEGGKEEEEVSKLASKQINKAQFLVLICRILLDMAWIWLISWFTNAEEDEIQSRLICIPGAYLERLRQDALSQSPHEHPFLSEGDVLFAWWARQYINSRITSPTTSKQTISLINYMNLRRIMQREGLTEPNTALLANAVLPIPTLMSARELMTKPLGYIAAALRRSLKDLGTAKQIQAQMNLHRAVFDKTGEMPTYGDGRMHMVICTNWTKGGFFDVDFSAAMVQEHQGDGYEPGKVKEEENAVVMKGKPSAVMIHITGTPPATFAFLSLFAILGKDGFGNYWILGFLRKRYWDRIERELER